MTPTLLIANRGEIACRVIRAAKSLGLRTVAVYSEADRDLPHVALADEAVLIGGAKPSESYLRADVLIEAAKQTGATLIHPGYGFLSENAAFASLCERSGLVFIGPSATVMQTMGDKENARVAAQRAGVPVLPGSSKLDVSDADGITSAGAAVGFPLLVKASAGGGGIGMRLVGSEEELLTSVASTSSMAHSAFGDGAVYLERFVETARHIEVQVFGFGDGTAVHLFERDCSLQRRHQKVVEESPAPGIAPEVRDKMAAAAVQLAESCSYQGAGTVEFLYDTLTGEFYFLEMNTRIQVEHPVTEMVTGLDLVASQIRLAMGESLRETLAQSAIRLQGHAVEARVYAERPTKNFLPSPGLLTAMKVPDMAHVRFETGYREGNRVTPFYDPLIMKVIAHGTDRADAIERLSEALGQLTIEGIGTNIEYLRNILKFGEFAAGRVHTKLLPANHAALVAS